MKNSCLIVMLSISLSYPELKKTVSTSELQLFLNAMAPHVLACDALVANTKIVKTKSDEEACVKVANIYFFYLKQFISQMENN